MKETPEDLQDIPTLTDVVKPGNPSLVFNLRPPPSSEDEEAREEEIPEAEAEAEADAPAPEEESTFFGLDQTVVIEHPPIPPDDFEQEEVVELEPLPPQDGILAELGLPPAFFEENRGPASEESVAFDESGSGGNETAQGHILLPEQDFNPESLLMALEAPVSDILQRHLESAREEILSLVREEIARHLKAHEASRD